MTSLVAHHFPETDISTDEVRSQLLFFSQIHVLTPVEQSDKESSELCPTYTPAPLGHDLPRFQQLMAELKGNETAFYQGYLSKMALEHMENRDPGTVRDIINSLHNPAAACDVDPHSTKRQEELWQARILLKLAEILRREEKELAQGLARLRERHAELLQDLKGDDELEDLFQALNDAPPRQFPVRVESLIQAWGRLLLAGDQHPWCLHCFTTEAAEPFFEINESMSGQRPVRLLRLPLPDCGRDPDAYPSQRQLWLKALDDWHREIRPLLHGITGQGLGATSLADLTRLAAQWTKSVNQGIWPPPAAGPEKNCAIPHLEIYLLNRPITTLVAGLCGRPAPSREQELWSHGLLALVSTRSSTCKG